MQSLRCLARPILLGVLCSVGLAGAGTAGASVFSENFDGVTVPALPAGWVATRVGGGDPLWLTDTSHSDTAPNAAFLSVEFAPAQFWLDSPPISITTTSAQLVFRHSYQFAVDPGTGPESPEDIPLASGDLQISIGGGAFQGILAAGGSFVAGGYELAWFRQIYPNYSTVVVNLPASAAGNAVVIRWRFGDSSPGGGGWWFVDSVRLCDGDPCDAVPIPKGLEVDPAGNGVLEPGETVDLDTSYYNNGPLALDLTGAMSTLDGPPGTIFQKIDSFASYGSIQPGALGGCITAPDCYRVSLGVPATRPAQHWDGHFREDLSSAVVVDWPLHVGKSFPDVPTGNPFYAFVENLFHNGVTGGCGAGNYCPASATRREQMAVFVLKAKYGSAYVPPLCAGVFTDVACPGPFADWIEDLHNQGVVAGCGAGPTYCPETRGVAPANGGLPPENPGGTRLCAPGLPGDLPGRALFELFRAVDRGPVQPWDRGGLWPAATSARRIR